MIHLESDACDTSAFGLSKSHITSEELISCSLELCVHACGPGLSSLNSCEAGCRWKMSQVLRADINHWRADTSEKKDRGRQKETREATDNKRTLTLLSSDLVKKGSHYWPDHPSLSQWVWTLPAQSVGKKGYEAICGTVQIVKAVIF